MSVVKYYSIAAASTGTTNQVYQARGRLHAIQHSLLANATITVYDSSTNTSLIATIVGSSLATNPPDSLDFKGVSFRKLTVITTGGILGMTVLYSED